MVNFPSWIPDSGSQSPALLDFFLSSDASTCSTMAFPPLGNSDHVVVSLSIDFPITSKQDALFHCIVHDYSRADWDGLFVHLRNVPWEDIFKLSASAAATEFCEWAQVGIDVYITQTSGQTSLISMVFTSCTPAIIHRNHFFRLYQQNISSESKVKFRQASNCCKSVLEAAKLAHANKTKSSSLPRNLALGTFDKLLIMFSTKVNLLYFLYSAAQRCCLLHLIKQNCWLKTFLRTLIVMTQVSVYLFSLLELI